MLLLLTLLISNFFVDVNYKFYIEMKIDIIIHAINSINIVFITRQGRVTSTSRFEIGVISCFQLKILVWHINIRCIYKLFKLKESPSIILVYIELGLYLFTYLNLFAYEFSAFYLLLLFSNLNLTSLLIISLKFL